MVGFTRLGLAEMTRRRQGASLQELLCGGPALPVRSPESTALAALRGALAEAAITRSSNYVVEVHPNVADALANSFDDAVVETRERLGGNLDIVAVAEMPADIFNVRTGTDA